MFEKIVVALDGSPLAERVLDSLESLLGPTVELLLVRVVEWPDRSPDESAREAARAYVTALEERLIARGIRASGHVLDAPYAAEEIVSFAGKSGASLICAATHGRTGLARVVLGSVAERIVRVTDRPVLLVNPLVPSTPVRFKRLLVPLDGCERSAEALPVAARIAQHFGSEVVLVHVEDRALRSTAALVGEEHALTERTFAHGKAQLPPGVPVRTITRVGLPGRELLYAVAEATPDVVLMTTHGRTGFARLNYGSIAEEVLRGSPVPVLVLRSNPMLAAKMHARRASAEEPRISPR